jgi:hypothetical protein
MSRWCVRVWVVDDVVAEDYDCDAGQDHEVRALMISFEAFKVAESAKCHPMFLGAPEKGWRARVPKTVKVVQMMQSCGRLSTKNKDVHVILLVPEEDWEEVHADYLTNFDVATFLEDERARGPFTFAGDHTRCGVLMGSKKYPNNKFWQSLEFTAYVAPDTAELKNMLCSISLLSNKKHEAIAKTDFEETIKMMADQSATRRSELAAEAGVSPGEYEFTKADQATLKAQWKLGGMSASNVNSHWAIANFSQRCLPLILRINASQVASSSTTTKKFKPPTSCYGYFALSGMDEDKAYQLLQAVLAGHLTMLEFNEKCKAHKAKEKVKVAIVEEIMKLDQAKALRLPDPTVVLLRVAFPRACSEEFMQKWWKLAQDLKASQGFPQMFYDQLKSLVEKDLHQRSRLVSALSKCLYLSCPASLHLVGIQNHIEKPACNLSTVHPL